jgi:hypothetical protein
VGRRRIPGEIDALRERLDLEVVYVLEEPPAKTGTARRASSRRNCSSDGCPTTISIATT